jgi:hypothetical protein
LLGQISYPFNRGGQTNPPRKIKKAYFAIYRLGDGQNAAFIAWSIGIQPDNRTALESAYANAQPGEIALLVCSPAEAEKKLEEISSRYFETSGP